MKPVLIIADPIEKLKPAGDTTLVLAREALRRKARVWWVTPEGIELVGDEIMTHAAPVVGLEKDKLPQLGQRAPLALNGCGVVLIRKDPPFDTAYVKLCWLLSLGEPHVHFVNRPSVLLRYHEKMVPLEAMAQGYLTRDDIIQTHIGSFDEARAWVRKHKYDPIVSKPFLGYGGNDVALLTQSEFLSAEPEGFEVGEIRITQPFHPEIRDRGDRRVFFLGGKLLAHFVRMPKAGGFVSNLAQGGTAVSLPLLPDERAVIDRLGLFLKSQGIEFAGADLIGRRVSEVNITSPTGLRAIEKLEGSDLASTIWDHFT